MTHFLSHLAHGRCAILIAQPAKNHVQVPTHMSVVKTEYAECTSVLSNAPLQETQTHNTTLAYLDIVPASKSVFMANGSDQPGCILGKGHPVDPSILPHTTDPNERKAVGEGHELREGKEISVPTGSTQGVPRIPSRIDLAQTFPLEHSMTVARHPTPDGRVR